MRRTRVLGGAGLVRRWAQAAGAIALALGGVALAGLVRGAPAGAAGLPSLLIFGTTTTVAPSTTTAKPAPTTATTAPTPTTAAPPPPALDAAFLPCSAPQGGGPCSAAPTQVELTYALTSAPSFIDVTWVPGSGRPAKAPAYDQPSAVINLDQAKACQGAPVLPAGQVVACLDWPTQLSYSGGSGAFVLNGTYQVAPCSASSSSEPCTPSQAYSPDDIGVAAPPAPPKSVSAKLSGGTVKVTWSPPDNPEPDQVGYALLRNGKQIYACGTHGWGPASGTPCPSPLAAADTPDSGSWTYSVASQRYGVDAAAANLVSSAEVKADPVVVAAAAPSPAPASPAAPPLETFGTPSTLPGVSPGPTSTTATTAAPEKAVDPHLPYSDNPVVGSPQVNAAAATETGPAGKISKSSLSSIALGVIALALAAHAWYLRGELRLAEARRRARLGPLPEDPAV